MTHFHIFDYYGRTSKGLILDLKLGSQVKTFVNHSIENDFNPLVTAIFLTVIADDFSKCTCPY